MKKTVFSIICIFCVLIGLLSCSSPNFDYDKFNFKEVEVGYQMTQSYRLFNKYKGVLQIPETYQDTPIVEIASMGTSFGRGITEVIGSKKLVVINSWTFSGTDGKAMGNLKRVEFPKDGSLKRIETMAFYWNSSLETVVLPDKIEYLGDGVFERCFALENLVIYNSVPPTMDGDIFNWDGSEYWHTKPNKNFTVYVLDEAIETYKQSAWSKYKIEPISSIKHIIKSPSITNDVTNNEQSQKGFETGHIIAISITGAILLALCIIAIIDYKKCKVVLKNSTRIKNLLELNKFVNFRRIQSRYNNQQACNSKRQLDNLSLDDYLMGVITSNESLYRNIVESISFNRSKYYSYIRQAELIKTTAVEEFCKELGFSLKSFLKYENNGKNYKLVYLDTNALSEFVNNTNGFSKNFLSKFIDDRHMLVTSVFNIMELNKTQNDFKDKIKTSLGVLPLGLLTNIEQLCEYEKNQVPIKNDIITFAVGNKPVFNVGIDDLFCFLEVPKTKELEQQRKNQLEKELLEWKEQRCVKNVKWQSDYNRTLVDTMIQITAHFPTTFTREQLQNCYSLHVCSYIRNMFIHNSSQNLELSSVIDSYNAAYLPYVEAYVTERTVGAWLKNAKNKISYIKEKTIYKVSDFFDR